MKRTWKFQHVSPDAQRLLDLGLKPRAIAKQLGIDTSTVTRWIAAGRLTRSGPAGPAPVIPEPATLTALPPSAWAAGVRSTYPLTDTQLELVTLAETALRLAQDPTSAPSVQLQAMGRFQSLVKDIAVLIRPAALEAEAAPVAATTPTARRDPRGAWLLQ